MFILEMRKYYIMEEGNILYPGHHAGREYQHICIIGDIRINKIKRRGICHARRA
jgi:hypothetical protein